MTRAFHLALVVFGLPLLLIGLIIYPPSKRAGQPGAWY